MALKDNVTLLRTKYPKLSKADVEEQFADYIFGLGLPRTHVPADSRWHSFKSDSGRWGAILDADEFPRGTVNHWRTGERSVWTPVKVRTTAKEHQKIKQDQSKVKSYEKQKAVKAAALYQRLPQAQADHRYLRNKEVEPGPCRVTYSGMLALPIYDAATDEFISIQWISETGEKRFSVDCRSRGGCLVLGEIHDRAIICEGYATGASLHEVLGVAVVAAFSCHNLKPVAQAIRKRYPDCKLVIAADNDLKTENKIGDNPGIRHANEAAQAVGATVVHPIDFNGDWNDYVGDYGKEEAVKEFNKAFREVANYKLPEITVAGGDLADVVREGIAALRAAGHVIFNRGGMLVRPIRIPGPEEVGGIRRARNALRLEEATADWISLRLAESAVWLKPRENRSSVAIDPPEIISRD